MNLHVDAHQHFWDLQTTFDYRWLDQPELAPIRRDRLPADLEPLLRAAGFARSVCVQTQHDLDENRWALKLAEQHSFIAGVVGWVDLTSASVEHQLEEFVDHPRFVGVRHVAQDEPDGWLVREDVVRGLKVLERRRIPFDVLVYPRQLPNVPTLARLLPELSMVVDHLAKPDIQGSGYDRWIRDFIAASEHPNVCCKLSGMVTEATWTGWTPDDLRPYVRAALDHFGADRLMIGSDWPVCEVAGSYADVMEATRSALGDLSAAEREAILGGTATRFYGLSHVD